MRNFKGEMRDENKKARPRYAPFRRRDTLAKWLLEFLGLKV